MKLSFEGAPAGDGGRLAKELLHEMKSKGLPTEGLQIVRESSESMDLGAIIEGAAHALYAAGYIAVFGKCIYDFLGKHATTIRITTHDGKVVEIPNNVDLETVRALLARLGPETNG